MEDYAGMGWEDDLRDHSIAPRSKLPRMVRISHTWRDHRFDPVVAMINARISRCEYWERSLRDRQFYYWDMSPEQLGVRVQSEDHRQWLSDWESRIMRLRYRLKQDLRDLNVPEVSTSVHWCEGYYCSTCKEAREKFKKAVDEWRPLSDNIG